MCRDGGVLEGERDTGEPTGREPAGRESRQPAGGNTREQTGPITSSDADSDNASGANAGICAGVDSGDRSPRRGRAVESCCGASIRTRSSGAIRAGVPRSDGSG
jgi:hypothetical protein